MAWAPEAFWKTSTCTVTGLVRAAGGKEIMLLCGGVGVSVGARACMETNRM